MEKFIPYEKMSKKAKKEFNAQKRNEWRMKPTERIKESKKIYSRARQKASGNQTTDGCFFNVFLLI